ncbi:MAG: hypothetical protein ACYDAA_10670 [Syntrophales bacterium]
MQKRDGDRLSTLNGGNGEHPLRLQAMVTCQTGRDVIVQTAVRGGEEAQLFAQIQDIRRESGKSEKKDNEKQRFPFMQ